MMGERVNFVHLIFDLFMVQATAAIGFGLDRLSFEHLGGTPQIVLLFIQAKLNSYHYGRSS